MQKNNPRSGRISFGGFFIVLLLGAVAGSVFTFFALEKRQQNTAARVDPPPPTSGRTIEEGKELTEAREAIEAYIDRKLREWDLDPDHMKEELARGGEIVREKSREIGENLPEGFNDVAIIAKIKAKYTLDSQLSGWRIIVGCENGHVTLSGQVDTPEHIGRAIVMALDVEGVVDVVSSLEVR